MLFICLYSVIIHFLLILVCFITTFNLINLVSGARVFFGPENRHILIPTKIGDMKILENKIVLDVDREDLVKIIRKNQFFQDIFSEQPDPMIIQYGHVCENPYEWEQRFEKNDFNKNNYQGKMRWGNKNGDYGEHYWDLGHTG